MIASLRTSVSDFLILQLSPDASHSFVSAASFILSTLRKDSPKPNWIESSVIRVTCSIVDEW